jgi:hypothetical protein
MARCPAIKASGERCKGDAIPGAGWCFSHDPGRAAERRRNASKGGKLGGRGRGSGELAEIKTLLTNLTDRVLGGEGVEALETGRAAVANQLVNTRLRAVELERKIKETDELEARIEELEQAAGR